MNRKPSFLHQILLTGTIVSLFLAIGYPIYSVQAQGRPLGAPRGANKSGGVRGSCLAADQTRVLTALVDESDPALTTQANPTLLFYFPFGRTATSEDSQVVSPTIAEFELQDQNEKSVLKNEKIVVSIPDKPGIVKLALPKTEVSLKPNQEYFWVMRVICEPNNNASNPSVAGWIKRVSPNSSSNIWFDRLDQLAQSPTNQASKWREFLKQFELQDLSQAPIVELKPQTEDNTNIGDN